MKKILVVVSIVVMCMVTLTGCNNIKFDQVTNKSDLLTAVTQTGISADDAKAVIESRLPEKPYDFFVELQGKVTENDCEYYRFQIYTLGTEQLIGEQGPYYQQFTYGWIYVDLQTGELYKRNTENQLLVAYSNTTIEGDAILP